MNSDELQSFLLQSVKDISKLLRAINHPRRLEIMARLINEKKTFSQLLKKTQLQKTALANHLKQLMNRDLIERVERGRYEITEFGYSIIQVITEEHYNSVHQSISKQLELMKHYSRGYYIMKKQDIDEKKVDSVPVYQPCWISFLGAASGILKSLGKDYDISDVGGYSGWSFLINVSKGTTCPSGPTAHKAYSEILKGASSLGYKIEGYGDEDNFPAEEGIITENEKKRAKKFFELVKKEISENDKPVILWGIPVPEYGIAYGYQDDSYIVSTFRHLNNQPETNIRFDELKAPGGLHYFFFKEETKGVTEKTDKDSIRRAIKMTEGTTYALENYVAGPNALEEWANVLQEGDTDSVIYHGNSYVGVCSLEGRATAVEFLDRLAKKYKGKPQSDFLIKASKEFKKSRDLLRKFINIFPFSFEGDLLKENREKGSEILREITPHEIKALEYLKEAYKNW